MCAFKDYWENVVRKTCSDCIDEKFIDLFTKPHLYGEEKDYVLDVKSHLYDPYGMLGIAYMRCDIDDALKHGDIKSARESARGMYEMFSRKGYESKFFYDTDSNEYKLQMKLKDELKILIGINV